VPQTQHQPDEKGIVNWVTSPQKQPQSTLLSNCGKKGNLLTCPLSGLPAQKGELPTTNSELPEIKSELSVTMSDFPSHPTQHSNQSQFNHVALFPRPMRPVLAPEKQYAMRILERLVLGGLDPKIISSNIGSSQLPLGQMCSEWKWEKILEIDEIYLQWLILSHGPCRMAMERRASTKKNIHNPCPPLKPI